ncbi:MAG: hypothetical protein WA981_06730 [Glaciecola sp.]
MNKVLLGLAVAATIASGNVLAQEKAGGSTAGTTTIGGVAVSTTTLAIAGAVVAGGLIANSGGSSAEPIIDDVDPVPTCNSGDSLVDGVCIGDDTVEVVVTGTGTATSTTTVAVANTYAPSN